MCRGERPLSGNGGTVGEVPCFRAWWADRQRRGFNQGENVSKGDLILLVAMPILTALTGWASCYCIEKKRELMELEIEWLKQAKIKMDDL